MNSITEERWKDLVALVLHNLPYREKEIHLGLELNLKRRMLFEDVMAFLEAFFEKNNISTGDFDFSRYFYYPPSYLVRVQLWLRGEVVKEQKEEDVKPLTIAMLLRAIEIGRWNTEEIETSAAQSSGK